ncbi:MAG: M28 family peptidase, partial [Gemmatimonadota bacterium]
EEAGLLGSEHLTAIPPVARDSIVAQLNMDMLGRNAPDSLFLIGSSRISSQLDQIVRREAGAVGLHLDYSLDAPNHPERLYERSDHYMYARYGIPVAFFFAGLHPDYHQPSAEVERIDFGKVERVAELVYRVAWDLANRPEPPARHGSPRDGARLAPGPG